MPGEAAFATLLAGRGGDDHRRLLAIRRRARSAGRKPRHGQDARIQRRSAAQDGGIGGAGTAFIVSNYSQVKEQAVNFIKFLMSKEEQELKAASGEGSLLNVTDVDATEYYTDPFKQIQQEWANEPSTVFWLDNLYPVRTDERDQGAVAAGLDRPDQRRRIPGQGRRQAGRAARGIAMAERPDRVNRGAGRVEAGRRAAADRPRDAPAASTLQPA